jgi:streptomycin 6-kinase
MIAMPEEFARSTVEREGEGGVAWLAELSGIVEELLGRWGCVPDGEVMHGGVGVIVPVRRRAQESAVLKVSFPHPGNVHEPDAFVAWGGCGAVLLYERDDERFAMLLERVQPSTLAEVEDGDEVVAVAGRLNHRLAIPAPPGLPRLREQADAWGGAAVQGRRGADACAAASGAGCRRGDRSGAGSGPAGHSHPWRLSTASLGK